MKKTRPVHKLLLLLGLLLVLASIVLIFVRTRTGLKIKRRVFLNLKTCDTGMLNNIKDKDFVIFPYSAEEFHKQIQTALVKIRKDSGDYKLYGISYRGASIGYNQPHYYFISISKQRSVTIEGVNIIRSEEESFANHPGVLEDEQIEKLITPLTAIEKAKPILNCYRDYSSEISREVMLYFDSETKELVWIVRAEDLIKSVPGPNATHSVWINALSGEIVQSD